MIISLTAVWAGPFTAAAGDILQPLGGAVMVSFGAVAPDGLGDPVIVGRLALTPGQVFYARATTEAVHAQFYLGPAAQGSTTIAAPVNNVLPTIGGSTLEGETLTADPGTWSNSPTSYAYQWIADFTPISGATAGTYVLTGAEVGAAITVQVTASNAGGAGTAAVSAATALVTAAPSTPVTSIAADGWRATYPAPPVFDPVNSPETITVTRSGFTSAGAATTVAEALTLMKRVRLPYPDQSTLTADQVALSDFVYAGDTLPAGVTNNSTLAYPVPIAMWLTPDLERVRATTFQPRLAVAHAYARNGRPVAAVEFIVTDGAGGEFRQTVNTMSSTQSPNSGLWYDFFEPTIDLTGLAAGAFCEIDVIIYPWVGEAFQASVHGSTYPSPSFTVLKFTNDRAGTVGECYAYVDPVNGQDSGGSIGLASASAATAAARPFLTLNAARTAVQTFNNANYTSRPTPNSPGGGTIRLLPGVHVTQTFTSPVSPFGNLTLLVEGMGTTRDEVIYQDTGATVTNSNRLPHKIEFRNLTLKKIAAGAVVLLDNNATGSLMDRIVIFRNVGGNQNGTSTSATFLNKTGRFFALDSHLISSAGTAQGNLAKCMNLVGCTGSTSGTGVYNACATNGSISPGVRPAAVEQPAAEGQLIQHCFFSQSDTSKKALDLSGATIGARGFAVVGTISEHIGGTTSPATFVQADNEIFPTQNMVFIGNTTVGARTNWLYNDLGTTPLAKSGFMRNSVNWKYNIKTDMFDNTTSGRQSGGRVGNWPAVFAVGCRNLAAVQGADDGTSAVGVGNWMGEVLPFNTVIGSTSTPIVTDWLDDKSSVASGGDGGGFGDYTPGPASALPFIPAGQAPYSVDQKGRAVPNDGSGIIGALQAA